MSLLHETVTPLNLVFVDFENVHQVDVSVIGAKAVIFTLLLGPKQTKLDAGLVEKLMEHAASVQFIRLTSPGKNALDFTLAYYVGRALAAHPTAYIHIISKDKGFDPMIEHLRSRHVHARRHESFATLTFSHKPKEPPAAAPSVVVPPAIPAPAKPAPPAKDEPLTLALERLWKNVTNRPKKKKTLISHLKSILGKGATEADATKLLEKLREARHLSIDDKDAVTYHL